MRFARRQYLVGSVVAIGGVVAAACDLAETPRPAAGPPRPRLALDAGPPTPAPRRHARDRPPSACSTGSGKDR